MHEGPAAQKGVHFAPLRRRPWCARPWKLRRDVFYGSSAATVRLNVVECCKLALDAVTVSV